MTQKEVPNISAIIQQLPLKLQYRFQSLRSFVITVINEEIAKGERKITLSQDEVHFIQLAALIYSLDSFFRMGTIAARHASETFEEFGYEGFQIGSSIFTKDNGNTRRGEELATSLRRAIASTSLRRAIQTSPSMEQLIVNLVRVNYNGRKEDVD